jgi:hypothetical protein
MDARGDVAALRGDLDVDVKAILAETDQVRMDVKGYDSEAMKQVPLALKDLGLMAGSLQQVRFDIARLNALMAQVAAKIGGITKNTGVLARDGNLVAPKAARLIDNANCFAERWPGSVFWGTQGCPK